MDQFPIGQVVSTASVMEHSSASADFTSFLSESLRRHVAGDWSDMVPEDQQSNQRAVVRGSRIFSSYRIPAGQVARHQSLWIITEADRSATTILFPSDY